MSTKLLILLAACVCYIIAFFNGFGDARLNRYSWIALALMFSLLYIAPDVK